MAERLQMWRGWKIEDVAIDSRMSIKAAGKYLPPADQEHVFGQEILDVCRRGKFIVFVLSDGALLCHNAMSGYWDSSMEPWTFDYVEGARESSEADVRVEIALCHDRDYWTLLFHDARMFGSLRYVTPEQLAAKLDTLGPDMLDTRCLYEPSDVMTEEAFVQSAQRYRKSLKEFLMDQGKVAGVGNIYAAEALWAARLLPARAANQVSESKLSDLFCSARAVLQAAIDRKLDYDKLMIYRRKECPACKGQVTSQKLKGRTTHWCPSCQS